MENQILARTKNVTEASIFLTSFGEASDRPVKAAQMGSKFSNLKFLLVVCFLLPTPNSFAEPSSATKKEINSFLLITRKKLLSSSEQAQVTLVTFEKNGDQVKRVADLSARRDGKRLRTRLDVLQPVDMKGTSLLSDAGPSGKSQWVYLPKSKQVRRLVASSKDSSLLGSEFQMDDLELQQLSHSARSGKVQVEKSKQEWSLRSKVKKGGQKEIDLKVVFDANTHLPLRVESSQSGKRIRLVRFLNYKELTTGVFRAQRIEVQNFTNGRKSTLSFKDHKVNHPTEESDFSPESLRP